MAQVHHLGPLGLDEPAHHVDGGVVAIKQAGGGDEAKGGMLRRVTGGIRGDKGTGNGGHNDHRFYLLLRLMHPPGGGKGTERSLCRMAGDWGMITGHAVPKTPRAITISPEEHLAERLAGARPGRARTREAILAAAMSLYAKEGYGLVTMRAIAQQLGFSAPAIYNYFISKEEIFSALQEIGIRLMAERVLQPETEDPLADLRAIFAHYYQFAKQQPEYFTLLYVDPSVPRVSGDLELLLRMGDVTAARVRRCVEAGIFPPGTSDAVAGLLWGAVHGPAVLRQVQAMSPETDLDVVALAGLDLALAGLRAGLALTLPTRPAYTGPGQPGHSPTVA